MKPSLLRSKLPPRIRPQRLKPQGGVTLVELVITIVVMSIAVVAIVSVMSASVSRSSNVLIQNKAIQLGQAYLDEILAKPFDEATPPGGLPAVTSATCNGPDTGESNRADFDDVDDYDGVDDLPPASQANGDFSDYAGFRVEVSVVCEDPSGSTSDHHKYISVKVTPPNGPSLSFAAYRSNF